MRNHEAEQLNDELLTETRHHSDTLRKWQKDIELNQQLRNEITTLKAQNERLVKALEKLVQPTVTSYYCTYCDSMIGCNEDHHESTCIFKEAKAVLEEVKK